MVTEELLAALSAPATRQTSRSARETYVLTEEFNPKDIKHLMQQFMINYLLEKCRQWLSEAIDDFIRDFQSTYEYNWQRFVRSTLKKLRDLEKQNNKVIGFNLVELELTKDLGKEMQIIFNIIIRLPMRKEIKNEMKTLIKKVQELKEIFDLKMTVDELWSPTSYWKNFLAIETYVSQFEECLKALEL